MLLLVYGRWRCYGPEGYATGITAREAFLRHTLLTEPVAGVVQ